MIPAPVDPAPLPEAMRRARRWLVWRSVPAAEPGKKARKIPFYASGTARNGSLDTEADTRQLVTLDEALAALTRLNATGLGFALGPDGTGQHWQGVDLDDIDAHPALAILAEDLPGYTESSPSGLGVHAIGYGKPFAPLGSNGTGIEAYSAGRYFTVTAENAGIGEPCDLSAFVQNRLSPAHALHGPAPSASVTAFVPPATLAELRSALASMRSDDREMWVANGHRLKALGEQGRALWLEWSQQSDKFDPADAARVWDSLSADRTGHAAIFAAAQRAGWLNPLSAQAPARAPAPDALSTTVSNALAPLTRADIDAAAAPHPHAFMSPDASKGLFPEGEVTVIGAPGREGKTTLMMAIACHYSLGLPLAGMAPSEVKSVLIYSAEDDRRQYARKAGAQWLRLSEPNQPRFLANLLIPDLHSPDLAAWRELVRLESRQPTRGPVVEILIAALQQRAQDACPPGLAIFETASTLSDAEEDNPGHKALIAALKHIAKQTGLAVILVHHTSQAAASHLPDLDISEADIRGGTTLVNNARQTHLVVSLGSHADPHPDSDARTVLRSLVAPGESARLTMLVCLSSSKSQDPAPVFFRWDECPPYGPRMVEVDVPADLRGKSWRALRGAIGQARVGAKAEKRLEQVEASVRLVVEAVTAMATEGAQPTAKQVSVRCGRSFTWAAPYLRSAVESGELTVTPENVPRVRGLVDVYRPRDWTPDRTNTPWGQRPVEEK